MTSADRNGPTSTSTHTHNETNRQWLLERRPQGMVRTEDFRLHAAPMPVPGTGEVLVRNTFLSFDPTQRGWLEDRPSYMPPVQLGEPMRATSVGEVVESRNPNFKAGDIVQGMGGWQEYYVGSATGMIGVRKLPAGVPPSWFLGVLGVTGLTAYFGLLNLGEPQAGQTVLVSGAAGATGSVAGQIARIKGCRVVGIAGGPDKCRWLRDTARFDATIDYKSENVDARIGELCPQGVNVYFENVGGEILEAALNHLALHARIVMCGGISGYNDSTPAPGPRNLMNIVVQRARMEGFIVIDYFDRMEQAMADLSGWIQSGQLVQQEDIQHGFENIPATLNRLFTGQNLGKQLLQL